MNSVLEAQDTEASNALSPEALHRAIAVNRLLVFSLGALILIMLASWLTFGLFHYFDEQPAQLHKQLSDAQQQISQLQNAVTEQRQLLEQQRQDWAQLHESLHPRGAVSSAEELNTLLAQTLIGQEHSYQRNVIAFKNGMRDLARMIPGSRDWLEHYDSALEQAKADSLVRSQTLQSWLNQHLPALPSPNTP